MYRNILVPLALDHGIAPQSLDIARVLLGEGGRITAVHVYEQPSGMAAAYIDEGTVKEAFNRAKSRLEDRVKDHPGVTARIVKGHSGRTIVDIAAETGADLIVIGSHKPGLIDYLLGNTAARVVRHAPCAVHVIRTS